MPRLRDARGVTHAASWTYGNWVGRTWCGYEFATPRNQWQRYAPEGLLIARQTLHGKPHPGMTLLEVPTSVDCMSCIVNEVLTCE